MVARGKTPRIDRAAVISAALAVLARGEALTVAAVAKRLKAKQADFASLAGSDDDLLRLLARDVDDAMARERVSDNDIATDKLFAILMARIDALQAQRAAYLSLFGDPAALRVLGPSLFASMQQALAQAGLDMGGPRGLVQAGGLLGVYLWTLRAWQKDTQPDLPATMRALDQGLRRAAQAAAWLGL